MTGCIAATQNPHDIINMLKLNKRNRDKLVETSTSISPYNPVNIIVQSKGNGNYLLPATWSMKHGTENDGKYPAAQPMINVPVSRLTEDTYAEHMREHRCLVPVNGFYLWRLNGQVYYVHADSGEPLLIAGLYIVNKEKRKGDIGEFEFTVITNDTVGRLRLITDYMPVLIDRAHVDIWLERRELSAGERTDMWLRSEDIAATLRFHEVDRLNLTTAITPDTPVAMNGTTSLFGEVEDDDWGALRIDGIPSPYEVDARSGTKKTAAEWGVSWPLRDGWKKRLERAWRDARDRVRGPHLPTWEELDATPSYGDRRSAAWGVTDSGSGWKKNLEQQICQRYGQRPERAR
ncbi:SOS response-associated peptidase family protein [Bifidobacterium leontopitheci]|uniref:Abasic site processing protein n=1 Tax=Bifidobacterium leontopitheci TaxID=2650774 RepID=A0A6I1GT79_9BIFI|nr:SOS response-associated peptidase family protein [Bifidobacterium leontopitheci]KAB7789671.1 bacteriophage protein [Bifidobacterium leontopitheci]